MTQQSIIQMPSAAGTRKDPDRAGNMIRVKLKLRTRGIIVSGVYHRPNKHGILECLVHEDDFKRDVEDKVELDHERLRMAAENHDRNLRAYVKARMRKELVGDRSQWDAEQLREVNGYMKDVTSEFQALASRGVKPIVEFEILERDLPQPKAAERANLEALTQQIAESTAVAVAKANEPMMLVMADAMAKMAAALERLAPNGKQKPQQ